jgi:hypothetical protein
MSNRFQCAATSRLQATHPTTSVLYHNPFKYMATILGTSWYHYINIQNVQVWGIQKYMLMFQYLKALWSLYFNSVQSNSKRFLCTSIHFNVGTWIETMYNISRADKHVGRAWISFRYLSSYNRCPHWSVRTCIKHFMSYSIQCWKNKFHFFLGTKI